MAYTINLTDGSIYATVADGTINTDSSIILIGKNYAGYGDALNENTIQRLENGANTTAPLNPLTGELWYNKTDNTLEVYNGSVFKSLAASAAAASAPASPIIGDMWFDTTTAQLKVYDGASWILVGPAFTSGTGTTGAIVEVITDDGATDHVVVSLYVDDVIVGIVSKDATFTPATPPTGFATISPGYQLSTTVAGAQFIGDATNALTLGGVAATGFLSSTADDSTSGILSVLNDDGLIVGTNSYGHVKMDGGGTGVILSNSLSDGDLILEVNDGGVPTSVITIDGASARARVPGAAIAGTDIVNQDFLDTAITNMLETADIGVSVAAFAHNHTGTYALIGGASGQAFATAALTVSGALSMVSYSENAVSYGTTGAIALDTSAGTYFYPTGTTTGAITFSFTNPVASTRVTTITLEMLGAANNAPVWPASVDWPGGTEPTWTTGTDLVSFSTRDGGTTWLGYFAGGAFA